jgi:PAS domain S-box-containing protein
MNHTDLYEQAYLLATHGIAFVSLKGSIMQANPAYANLLGYRDQELLALNIDEIIQPIDFIIYTQLIQQLADGKTSSIALDIHCLNKGGRLHAASLEVTMVKSESGESLYYIHKMINILENKVEEEKYREIENLFHLISANVQDIISYNTVDGICNYCTPSIETILGYNPEEIIGNHTVHLYHPEDLASLMKRTFSDNDTITYRALHKKGYYIWVESTFKILLDPKGTIGITRDITERKKHEESLAEAQRIASVGSWEHDIATGIITCSAQFFRIYDMNSDDFGGTPDELMKLVHPEDRVHFNNSLELCIMGRDLNIEFRHIQRDGNIKYLHARGTISENKQSMHGTIQDITEQKQLIRAVTEAESTNKAKSEFLAMMSHEIRTPLNGVIGITDLLMETNLNKTQREYAEIICKSGNALLNIINDILDFSKIESGKMELVQESFQVVSCIQETFEVLKSQAQGKNLEMQYHIDENVPIQLQGDYGKLRQVLLNLAGNALKFTSAGKIGIEVKLLNQQSEDVIMEFKIKDTGIGISKDKARLLFTPFTQLDQFMTRKYGGTGLGLAISKKLVELMGGEIRLEESSDQGTTFAFTIKVKLMPNDFNSHSLQSDKQGDFPTRTLQILIAEDNAINQLVLKKILERQGHNIDVAENGHETIEAIKLKAYDLVFMDLQMPLMNGFEATERIKKMEIEKPPVIIAVTANAFVEDREKCLTAGMDDYISKPIKLAEINEIVNNYVNHQYVKS